jgi:hypothetical protein
VIFLSLKAFALELYEEFGLILSKPVRTEMQVREILHSSLRSDLAKLGQSPSAEGQITVGGTKRGYAVATERLIVNTADGQMHLCYAVIAGNGQAMSIISVAEDELHVNRYLPQVSRFTESVQFP